MCTGSVVCAIALADVMRGEGHYRHNYRHDNIGYPRSWSWLASAEAMTDEEAAHALQAHTLGPPRARCRNPTAPVSDPRAEGRERGGDEASGL
jgi:hypothetical protein